MRHTFVLSRASLFLLLAFSVIVCGSLAVSHSAGTEPQPVGPSAVVQSGSNPAINWPNGASYVAPRNPFAASGYGGQCTAFAWGRANEVTGITTLPRGNGKTWYASATSFQKGAEPRANSIAVWAGDTVNPFGHVAYIERVEGDTVFFSEANIEKFKNTNFGGGYDGYIKQKSKQQMTNRGRGVGRLTGYIYLINGSIRTASPNGGETWAVGSTQTIRWTYTGDSSNLGPAVKIELLKGGVLSQVIPSSIMIGSNGNGSYSWRVPTLPSGSDYRLRVSSTRQASVTDTSDGNFTIAGGQPRAVVSTSLKLSPSATTQKVGQKLTGTFTIANRGNAELEMSKVLIGGLVGGTCGSTCPDFSPVVSGKKLAPGATYNYTGTFTLPREGSYTFLVSYQKPDGSWAKPVDSENGTKNAITITVQKARSAAVQSRRGTALKNLTNDDGKKIPLILVHGIHGSDDLTDIYDSSKYWSAFIAKFNGDATLKKTYALFAFQYYSDAESVQDIATQLGNKIDVSLKDRPHVLLVHSMGGLVAKSYMVDYQHHAGTWSGTSGGDSTLLLITLATPHHGTPGANDPAALRRYLKTGWEGFFNSINFLYWSKSAGFLSPPSLNSGVPNRGDLRWDNYDSAIEPGVDTNLWLAPANRRFATYSQKTIAYGGYVKLVFPDLTAAAAYIQIGSALLYNDHQRLEFANESMVYGLDRKFGITDGMVPYYSSLLCDPGPFLIDASNTTFICSSPTRVRRFEPGTDSESSPHDKTLSITRRARGYDHLDMLEHVDVLNWVVKDLKMGPNVLVSTSLQVSPGKGPYSIGQDIAGTFSITNRGNTELDTKQVLIAGRVGDTCPDRVCPDFTIRDHIKLAPGQTYNYSGNFTPSLAGRYTFSVAYQTPDDTWVIPVDTEKGTKNKLELIVQIPPPTLTRSAPSSLGASPNSQTVYLYGTGLSRILYCRVQAPNGKFSFIYLPLSQVVGHSDVELLTRIKFPTPGTYYISAFTKDKGQSNDLAIEVR